jgi:hypothetical protein
MAWEQRDVLQNKDVTLQQIFLKIQKDESNDVQLKQWRRHSRLASWLGQQSVG